MRVLAAVLLAVVTVACADASTGTTTDDFSAVTEALTIDPTAPPNYAAQALPAYYTPILAREDRTPANNPTTNQGALLGRVLFYDVNLSRTRNVSCASCHRQSLAFGDTARFSLGIDGVSRTGAHSMRLGNARFNESARYFWDRRAASLEVQTTQPIQDSVEMGFDATHGGFSAVIARLDSLPYYQPLFRLAFGTSTITEPLVRRALAQYVRSIIAVNSRWDVAFATIPQGPGGPNFLAPLPGFTAEETRGQEIFFRPPNAGGAGCQGCHAAPSFSLAANSQSNGLDAGQTIVFRSPSLKDVGRSARFMHDGRFSSLEQVVEFYNSGVQSGVALDNRLRGPGGGPQRLNLSAADKAALVAFLRTLNEQTISADPKFSNPFRP
jgi:cytochrome c peroxidase